MSQSYPIVKFCASEKNPSLSKKYSHIMELNPYIMIKKDSFTNIPNEIFDYWCSKLSSEDFYILTYLYRNPQAKEVHDYSEKQVSESKKRLEKLGILPHQMMGDDL